MSLHRHCEERSDEAIQKRRHRLDCFAPLAMTISALALAIVTSFVAQARDFEMGGDSPYHYSVSALAPDTATHDAAAGSSRTRRAKPSQAVKPATRRSPEGK
jgi:hypothetical protein